MTTAAAARIALAAITPSTTNPRKRFDAKALEELADSIKKYDVLQPILLRPNGGPGKYELVAGERRFRAAKAAGLADIPATVRTLTDAEVLEVQVIENLQREDLHELEEAEGYEQLLKCAHPDGSKYSVDEIAAKVGKSRSYVFARLKLCALCPEARKVFYAGDIDASKALLIARIGHHDTQRQALRDVTAGEYGRGPMSYREAHQHILQTYMLQLKSAPFDIKDEKLLAKAGACGPCPKRTGNQADLFGDVKSADVCTDPKCFDDKRQAHYSVAVRELEAKGHKVISGAAAKKAFPQWDGHSEWMRGQLQGGYVKVEDNTYANGRSQKVSALLGPDYEPILIQHPGTGQIIKVATQQAITAAASKASKQRKGSTSTRSRAPAERKKSADVIFRERLFAAILPKLPEALGKAELQRLATRGMQACDSAEILADLFIPRKDGKKHDFSTADKALRDAIPKMSLGDLARLAVAGTIGEEIRYTYGKPKALLEAAAHYKVDPAKVKKAIADEEKVAAAAAKEKKAKPAKKMSAGAAALKK